MPYINKNVRFRIQQNLFSIYQMLRIVALAFSADHFLFGFCKVLLLKCSGKKITEQIIQPSLTIGPGTNLPQC